MNRREMFGAVAVGVLAAVAPAATASPELIPILRYCYRTDSWSRVRMYELKAGDVFRLGDVGTFLANVNPVKNADGIWEINAAHQISEKTNEWVPRESVG